MNYIFRLKILVLCGVMLASAVLPLYAQQAITLVPTRNEDKFDAAGTLTATYSYYNNVLRSVTNYYPQGRNYVKSRDNYNIFGATVVNRYEYLLYPSGYIKGGTTYLSRFVSYNGQGGIVSMSAYTMAGKRQIIVNYYPNGKIALAVKFDERGYILFTAQFNESGQKTYYVIYDTNQKVSSREKWTYYVNGRLATDEKIANGLREITYYFDKSTIAIRTEYYDAQNRLIKIFYPLSKEECNLFWETPVQATFDTGGASGVVSHYTDVVKGTVISGDLVVIRGKLLTGYLGRLIAKTTREADGTLTTKDLSDKLLRVIKDDLLWSGANPATIYYIYDPLGNLLLKKFYKGSLQALDLPGDTYRDLLLFVEHYGINGGSLESADRYVKGTFLNKTRFLASVDGKPIVSHVYHYKTGATENVEPDAATYYKYSPTRSSGHILHPSCANSTDLVVDELTVKLYNLTWGNTTSVFLKDSFEQFWVTNKGAAGAEFYWSSGIHSIALSEWADKTPQYTVVTKALFNTGLNSNTNRKLNNVPLFEIGGGFTSSITPMWGIERGQSLIGVWFDYNANWHPNTGGEFRLYQVSNLAGIPYDYPTGEDNKMLLYWKKGTRPGEIMRESAVGYNETTWRRFDAPGAPFPGTSFTREDLMNGTSAEDIVDISRSIYNGTTANGDRDCHWVYYY